MAIDDGGPAFPHPPILARDDDQSYWSQHPQPGMSLRDWFAGQVLIGLSIKRAGTTDAADAVNAYALADAMLAERSKK